MKKYIILILIFLFPINVLAYSSHIIPSGQTLGIEIQNKGILVIGFYKVENRFNRGSLKVGDAIIKVANTEVNTIDELVSAIEDNVDDNKVNLTIKRGNKVYEVSFELIFVDNTYKTGLYVKDNITGIGTLTYIDPETKIYGALGHEIIESNSGELIEVKSGKIFKSSITKIDRSSIGTAGTKNAKFYSNTIYGSVLKNTNKGIYGIYTSDISNYQTLEVGMPETLKTGVATIYTVLTGEDIKEYEIYIDKIDKNNNIKNIHFRITSEELINAAGGIVQGMSGSPIIQDNKIYGAVTHVILDNPTSGYGLFITTMLKEGES
ncbi:MAG: SpoIVB peptidase S55 domain-containing protein [Bacilli bacterium]|nr:SpoIVB peptidase S55 domain-containing protein [Bacilli bacterium]